MRNCALAIYTVFLLVFNSFSGLLGISKVQASSITPSSIVELTNADRTKYGLNTLKTSSKLTSAALAKANNMFKLQYWNHFGPNGESPWDFIKASSYSYIYAGENLAKGFKTAEGVEEAWMASPTHRANLLSGNYKEMGVAVVSGKLLGEDIILVVQMFGNQTNEVVASPKSNSSTVQTEPGETLSISITSPKDGSVLNDPTVDIVGTAKNNGNDYSILMYEGNTSLGGFETNGSNWTWDKKSDWAEGSHEVTAKLQNNSKIKDSVKFKIDSRGPQLSDFKAERSGFNWSVSGKIDDADGIVNIVSGDFNQSYVVKSDGTFSGSFSNAEINGSVMFVASDKLGNVTQKDLSDYFKTDKKGDIMGTFLNSLGLITSKDAINAAFLGFILILLIIEVYTYMRKKIIAKHGLNLFTVGFWWLLLSIGIVSGFSGRIS